MEDVKSINDVNSKLEENYKKYSEYLKSEEGRLYIINDIYWIRLETGEERFPNIISGLLKYEDTRTNILENIGTFLRGLNYNSHLFFIEGVKYKDLKKWILSKNGIKSLKAYGGSMCGAVIGKLLEYPESYEIILSQFEEFYEIMNSYEDSNIDSLFQIALKSEKGLEKVDEYIQRYEDLMKSNYKLFFGFFSFLKECEAIMEDKSLSTKYKNISNIVNRYKLFINVINKIAETPDKEFSDHELKKIQNRFIALFQDEDALSMASYIIKEHFKDCDSIRYKGSGAHAIVIQFGKYVLKIILDGKYIQLYHPLMLPPRFRKKFNRIILEIFDLVDTDTRNIPKSTPLDFYKKINDDGCKWPDARMKNIGRLLEDIKPPNWFYKTRYEIFKEMGIICKYSTEELLQRCPLKKGDLCNIDLQDIYWEKNTKKPDYYEHADPQVIEYIKKEKWLDEM